MALPVKDPPFPSDPRFDSDAFTKEDIKKCIEHLSKLLQELSTSRNRAKTAKCIGDFSQTISEINERYHEVKFFYESEIRALITTGGNQLGLGLSDIRELIRRVRRNCEHEFKYLLQTAVIYAFDKDNQFKNVGAEIINLLLDSNFVNAYSLVPRALERVFKNPEDPRRSVVEYIRSEDFMSTVFDTNRRAWLQIASRIETLLDDM